MAKNHVQVGDTLSLIAPTGGVVSGMIYIIGALPVVAEFSAVVDEPFEGSTTGVYILPKVLADAPEQGAKAYLKADGTVITVTATGNKLVGVFTHAQANGDTKCSVRLNGVCV